MTKIDAFMERLDAFGEPQRVAVGCKSNAKTITKAMVTNIYAGYLPLIEANLIDIVLIVTISPLAPSAITYVKQAKALRHLELVTLQNSIIDSATT